MAQGTSSTQTLIHLTLTAAEADALRVVVSKVGGIHTETARGHIDQIARALDDAGVEAIHYSVVNEITEDTGIIFTDHVPENPLRYRY